MLYEMSSWRVVALGKAAIFCSILHLSPSATFVGVEEWSVDVPAFGWSRSLSNAFFYVSCGLRASLACMSVVSACKRCLLMSTILRGASEVLSPGMMLFNCARAAFARKGHVVAKVSG